MTLKSTPEGEMSELHRLLAVKMKEILDGGTPTASELQAIRGFLKDNGIMCDADNPNPETEELIESAEKVGNVVSYPFDPQQNNA